MRSGSSKGGSRGTCPKGGEALEVGSAGKKKKHEAAAAKKAEAEKKRWKIRWTWKL